VGPDDTRGTFPLPRDHCRADGWLIVAWRLVAAVIVPAASLVCAPSTALLAHFNGDARPAHSVAADKARGLTYVPGRFGQAVRLERLTGANISFDVKKVLTGTGGTIEFWYKPEWDMASKLGEDEGPKWLRGKPVRVFFFENQSGGSGVRFYKNQYNVLSYAVTRRYKTICFVACHARAAFKGTGDWVHLAASWDRHEARLFANGRLLSIANQWDLDYFQSPLRLGGHSGGSGAFDELRISSEKLYVSSFSSPARPFTARSVAPRSAAPSSVARPELESSKISFYTDLSRGDTANFARGDPRGRPNRALSFAKNGVRLDRGNDGVGDTLAYEVAGNLSPFMGTVQVRLTLSENYALPFTVFESTHLAPWDARPVGVQLVVNEERQLEWRSVHGPVASRVASAPMELAPGTPIELACSWRNSETALYRDRVKIAEKGENVIPPRIGRYFFIGSNCLAKDTLCGEIHEVVIHAADYPIELPLTPGRQVK